jgi:hypothetical protein
MEDTRFSRPLSLKDIQITDEFWKNEMELVRKEVIPYQWEALNDRVKGAAPSYCMRNFKVAGKMNSEKKRLGGKYVEPAYTFRGFEALPENPDKLDDDKFYGFVFQDTDFSKWIEAVGYSLTQHPDKELEKIADEAIDIVCAAQQEDGYLDTYYIINGKDKIFTNLRDHHELYCFGHLTEGAVAYYEATGKDKLLKAAERFADYIDNYFGADEGKCKGYPGHEIAEMALVRLYEATGNKRYLDLSAFFIEERGKKPYYFDTEDHPDIRDKSPEKLRYMYNQAHLPVRQQDEATGHAVRAVYLYSGMADIARLKNDDTMFEACERLWNNIVDKKMYITGGIGATHLGEAFSFEYDLPNDTAYAETCASIGLVFFARRMLEMKPDAKYANVMERALYNGILSGMALDGKSFFYVNPLEVNPEACHKDERKFHVKPVRQKWFGCACCPPNIARLLSSIGSYAYTENEDTLFIHLYIGSTISKKLKDKEVDININSNFPWSGDVNIKVRAKNTDFKLAMRLPDWCEGYGLKDKESFNIEEKDGYLYISKSWADEDEIAISFDMEPRLIAASDKVREDIGKVAVIRGPVVYCLEEKDNGSDLHMLKVKPDTDFELNDFNIEGTKVKKIQVKGKRILKTKNTGNKEGLYHILGKVEEENVTLTYIPYYTWANRGENEMQVWTNLG